MDNQNNNTNQAKPVAPVSQPTGQGYTNQPPPPQPQRRYAQPIGQPTQHQAPVYPQGQPMQNNRPPIQGQPYPYYPPNQQQAPNNGYAPYGYTPQGQPILPQGYPIQQPQHIPPKKKNSFEQVFGGKIINIIGVLFVLVGVIFGLYYTYTFLENNLIKIVIAYAVGVLFIGLGEIFKRTQNNSFFATGLCAGGISILFATTGVGYFELGVFNSLGALIACVVLFALSLFLTMHYDSELIGIFSVIGGYFPIIMLRIDPKFDMYVTTLSVCLAYFFLINILVLFLAQKKSWTVIKYFSLFLNIACTSYLISKDDSDTTLILLGVYILLNFVLYMAMITSRPLRMRDKLKANDIILLITNTLSTFIFSIFLVENKYLWIVSAVFAVTFLALHFLWDHFLPKDSGVSTLYLILGITFVFLTPLLVLNNNYLGLIWVILGITMLIVALVRKHGVFRVCGLVISSIGFTIFYITKYFPSLYHSNFYKRFPDRHPSVNNLTSNPQFEVLIQFFVIVVALVALLVTIGHLYRRVTNFWKNKKPVVVELLVAFAMANIWMFINFSVDFGFSFFQHPSARFWSLFTRTAVALIMLFISNRLPFFQSVPVRVLEGFQIFYAFSLLVFAIDIFGVNMIKPLSTPTHLVAVIAELFLNSFAVYIIYMYMKRPTERKTIPSVLSSLTIAISSFLFTMFLVIFQIQSSEQSMIITFMLLIWALGMVVYGFARNSKSLRIIGLSLAGIAVFKVLVYDLRALENWQKAISYVVAGLLLIGISFAYQFFSKQFLPPAPPKSMQPPTPPFTGQQTEQAYQTQTATQVMPTPNTPIVNSTDQTSADDTETIPESETEVSDSNSEESDIEITSEAKATEDKIADVEIDYDVD